MNLLIKLTFRHHYFFSTRKRFIININHEEINIVNVEKNKQ